MLFVTLFTIPQFLAIIAGYNAQQAGQVIFVTGISAILGAIVFGILILLALGILIGDLLRRARLLGELESEWRREDQMFLDDLRRTG